MLVRNILILILGFYFLVLFEGSFLAHFSIKGITPNLVFILVLLFNFFSSAENAVAPLRRKLDKYIGLWASLIAGFFLDVFSVLPFGVFIIFFLIVYFFIKNSFNSLKEPQEKFPFLYFLPLFLISFIFSEFIFGLFYHLFNHFSFINFLIKLVYNAILGILGFYIFKFLYRIYK